MKKLLSVALAAATVASVGVSAFAADYDMGELAVLYDNESSVAGTNQNDTVTPDQKVYVSLDTVGSQLFEDGLGQVGGSVDGAYLMDEDFFKFKYKKGSDNSKMILDINLVEKNLGGGREEYIEIKLADDYTDDEYKINPTFTFSAKENLYLYKNAAGDYKYFTEDEVDDGVPAKRGYTIKYTDADYDVSEDDEFEGEFTIWISNTELEADEDFAAGTGGVTLKPTKNDDNEIIWYDENDDIAMLTFEGDSSVDNFFPKLSTKWDNSTYATYFADQDAFIFDFISNPDISSTSRPVLTIYDPYYDYEEDESLVDSENVVIYQVVDGELVDVTADWSYGETDDGEMAYTTKTRQLGTYIFCEVAVAGSEEVVEEPVDDGKVIPNTGR